MIEGAEIGNAYVPVGSAGRLEGDAVRGDASKVVVMVVTITLGLKEVSSSLLKTVIGGFLRIAATTRRDMMF